MHSPEDKKDLILLGKWNRKELDHIIHESSMIVDIGERIDFLSRQFLGIPYKESTLIGDMNTPEVFVINLEGMDCLTFLEYIEAMRLSRSFTEFIMNLERVRYYQGMVTFEKRRHFFTDWGEYNPKTIEDVTALIGGSNTVSILKRLNLKKDGTCIIPGLDYKDREIKYIPVNALDARIMDKLKAGDYAGIYSDEEGLDVSHVGIIIRAEDGVYLRHASSRSAHWKVMDKEFKEYIANKQGLLVLRPE